MGKRSIADTCCRCGGVEGLVKGVCRPCRLAYAKAYYQTNKDRLKAANQRWAENNREASRAIKKKWADANPDKQRLAIAAWNSNNSERASDNRKRWNYENAALKNTYTVNRRHKLIGNLSKGIVKTLMEKQNGLCACCGAPLVEYHIDHIRPVSKGGTNTDDNVQLLTPTCNMRKSDKWPIS